MSHALDQVPGPFASLILYPAQEAFDLLRVFRGSADRGYPGSAVVALTTAPPVSVIPVQWHQRKVVALIAASTPQSRCPALVEDIGEVAEPITGLIGPMPTRVLQMLLDELWPAESVAAPTDAGVALLDDALIDRLCKLHHAAPDERCEIRVRGVAGPVAPEPRSPAHTPLCEIRVIAGRAASGAELPQAQWAELVIGAAARAVHPASARSSSSSSTAPSLPDARNPKRRNSARAGWFSQSVVATRSV